ncbi:MAG: hypothetical protein ACT4PU_12355 [Planctomycetota bacterium]
MRPVALILGLLLAAQATLLVRSQGQALTAARMGHRWLTEGGPEGDLSYLPLAASRALAELEGALPLQARVLVVLASPFPVAFDFYLQPRHVAVLMPLDDALIARAAAAFPVAAGQAQRWADLVTARGQRLTPQSLHEGLQRADYLLSFHADPAALGVPPERLEFVARSEMAAVWRVLRDDADLGTAPR